MTPSAVALTQHSRERRTDDLGSHLRAVQPDSATSHLTTAQLIEDHTNVAVSMAARYKNRGIDLEDLQQVALLGLTKAAQRFDPNAGHSFLSYAVPTIRGELRRHFRDHGWMVRPPRRVQEMQAAIGRATAELEQLLNRSPRPTELAEHLGAELDDVVEALSADGCFAPASLDAPIGTSGTGLGELVGEDQSMSAIEARMVLEPLIAELPERDRRILVLRFVEERTQQDIGDAVGLTQAQVSRVLAQVLRRLRNGVGDTQPAA
jgi:RNA polymerase sigma-B factor